MISGSSTKPTNHHLTTHGSGGFNVLIDCRQAFPALRRHCARCDEQILVLYRMTLQLCEVEAGLSTAHILHARYTGTHFPCTPSVSSGRSHLAPAPSPQGRVARSSLPTLDGVTARMRQEGMRALAQHLRAE